MERSANYALVGVISTVLLVAMIVFLLWLTNFALSARYDTYNVIFHGPISGLSRGGDVQFNGIKVGDVSDISLDARDPNLVVAKIKIRSDTPVRQDSEATLEPQGITGVTYIQITAGATGKPLLKDVWPQGSIPEIKSKPGAFSSLLTGGGDVMQQAGEALGRINRVLSDENIQEITAIISDVQSVTSELRNRKAIIAHADQTLLDADKAAKEIQGVARSARGLVDNNGRKTLDKIGDAAGEIQTTATDLRQMIDKLKGPTGRFATSGLPQLTAAMVQLQTSLRDMDRLIEEVRRDPRSFIGKPPARQVEVKP